MTTSHSSGVYLPRALSPYEQIAAVARLKQLREAQVLQGVEGHRVDARNGVVVCACGDCDQRRDYDTFLSNVIHERMHPIHLNGGALLIPPASPLHFVFDDDGTPHAAGAVMRIQMRGSAELKDIRNVALVAHVPCGAALEAEMCVDQTIEWLIKAKVDLRDRYRSLGYRFACFLHVDWPKLGIGTKPSRTYFLSLRGATTWLARPPEPLISHLFEEAPIFSG